MNAEDRDLEALLRRALADEAGGIEPAGDGLRRIRERTARPGWRTRWSRWSTPALALVGATAVLAAVTVLPRLLPAEAPAPPAAPAPTALPSPDEPTPTAPIPAGPPDLVATAPSLMATPPTPAPAPSAVLIPGAGVADMATIWPYASRGVGFAEAEQDIADGTVPDLTRPERAATAFVRSYLGSDGELTAVSVGAWQAGLRMEVRRGDVPVSLVYLVRVRVGNDAPYVVVDAFAPGSLTLLPPVAPRVLDGELTAGGTTLRRLLRRGPRAGRPAARAGARTPLAAAADGRLGRSGRPGRTARPGPGRTGGDRRRRGRGLDHGELRASRATVVAR